MPSIQCPKHGGHGTAAVCPHLAAIVNEDHRQAASQSMHICAVTVCYEGLVLGPTWLCSDCAARHGVPKEGLRLDGESGLERYWSDIGFVPVCRYCLDEKLGSSSQEEHLA